MQGLKKRFISKQNEMTGKLAELRKTTQYYRHKITYKKQQKAGQKGPKAITYMVDGLTEKRLKRKNCFMI